MWKLRKRWATGGLKRKYLENLVERVLRPKPEVFDSYMMSQVLSFGDVSEPAKTVNATNTNEPLLQNI